MELLSQRPMFSSDPSTRGFDLSSGKEWIYPVNYPVRDYQYSIVESALYNNTLVCLPTGLGKTFIAAVVMYNFWRWYPQAKIVFLAPTKPLVAQQIHACHDIMGISSDETIELTGATDQKKRQIAWSEHRVIFATPQVFHKDLEKNIVPNELVKCVVVDEAHKALGRHSYCESIRLLSEKNQYFRVLGLSATPGGKLEAVQEVVKNLHITHLELRDDTSSDIIPYINERKLDIVLVGLGAELERFKDRYITIMDRHVRILVENNIVRGNTGNISKGRIFMIQKEFGQKSHRAHNHGQVMKVLTILMTMYHAYDLMVRHGLRAFYNFYQNHMDKFWLKDEPELMQLLEEIIYYVGPFPDVRPLPDGSLPEIPENIRFGHNKFHKLKDLLLRHFESFEDKEEDTRAIVFVEYRDIVNEVYVLLLQSRPLLRPQKFVGQAGQKQRQQKAALEDFRSNKVNVLISTSVGEEGLDVGEVDLIVCFDMSQVSPIRLVQRMGRTGRKRDGHIVVLVTDGKEHQTLKSAMSRRDSLNNKVLQSSGIINALHETSPRMVPTEFDPECHKMQMTVLPKNVATKGKGKAKEPKKSRKRTETTKKPKNSKPSEPSTSNNKPASQSSMMKFLKRTRDEAELDVDNNIVGIKIKEPRNRVTQSSQQSLKNNNTINLSNVKLLSSDNAAVEFLTLCAMKRSKNEQTNVDRSKTNPYLPSYHAKNECIDACLNFEIPDLKILNCLNNITEYVAPPCENDGDELMVCEDSYLHDDDYRPVYTQRSQTVEQDSKFEALLDDSTTDSDVTTFDAKEVQNDDLPETENVDWAANENDMRFEDLIDEWSDDSMKSLGKNAAGESATNDQLPSKFEDILNSSSDDSDETYYSPTKKADTPIDQRSNVVGPNEISIDVTSQDTLINSCQGSRLPESPETMLDESVDLLKDCEPKINSQLSTDEIDRRHFKIISDIREASTSGTPNNCQQSNLDANEKSQFLTGTTDRRSFKIVSQAQRSSTSLTPEILDHKERSQTLANEPVCRAAKIVSDAQEAFANETKRYSTQKGREAKEVSQSLSNEHNSRHSTIGSNAKDSSTNNITQKNLTQVSSSMMTISQTLREIDRISSRASTSNESHVNNVAECQRSQRFSDRPPSNCNSRLSGVSVCETAKVLTSCSINEQPEENSESDEDMFGVDDLMVDSDFEEEINKIERSADTDINTSDKQSADVNAIDKQSTGVNASDKRSTGVNTSENRSTDANTSHKETSFDASVKVTDIEADDCEILFGKEKPKNFVPNLCKITPLRATPKVELKFTCLDIESKNEKNPRSSPLISVRRNLNDNNGADRLPNDRRYSAVKSSVDDINIDDFNSDNRDSGISDAKNSPGASSSEGKKNLYTGTRDSKYPNDRHSSIVKSPIDDIIIDDFDWDSDISRDCKSLPAAPSCSKKNSEDLDWSNKIAAERKVQTPSTKVFLPDKSFDDIDWNGKIVKKTTSPFVSEKKFQSYDCENKPNKNLPLPAKTAVPDEIFEDCDWSSDFEAFSTPLKSSTSFHKVTDNQESPKSNFRSSLNNSEKNSRPSVKFGQVEDANGWIKTDKPKLRLTLGRKLTKNIHKNLQAKQTTKRLSPAKRDSDSENEFAVTRIETAATREVESDYFAKPADPVVKLTRPGTLGMYNPRRVVRGPLSLRRNDVNKINVESLRDFSAPSKYTPKRDEQRDTQINRSVGAGRQKSASLDLDTRKKKKSNQKNPRRLRVRSEFVDDEAEVSTDEDHTSGSSGVDEDLNGFISYTQHTDDHVDMHAHYLQTVRSPRRHGGFHIRKPKTPSPDRQIYSQFSPDEPNSYLYDSFCVAEDDGDVFEDSEIPDESIILEELSMKSRKRKRGYSTNIRAKSKRKLVAPDSEMSSSEDETEKLRRQIQDESFVLRNKCE